MLETQEQQQPDTLEEERCVWVCQHQTCSRHGSAEVLRRFQEAELLDVKVSPSGCMGQCSTGPTVRITPDETWYYRVKPEDVPRIVDQHLNGGIPVEDKLNPRIHPRFDYYSPV